MSDLSEMALVTFNELVHIYAGNCEPPTAIYELREQAILKFESTDNPLELLKNYAPQIALLLPYKLPYKNR